MKKKSYSIKDYIVLYAAFFLFSCTSITNKISANYELLSLGFLVCYGITLLIIGVYAIVWQQILKKFDLSDAYANRSVLIIFSLLWSVLFFHETITWKMIVGALMIVGGLRLVVDNE